MMDLCKEDVKFIKKLANSDFDLQTWINETRRNTIDAQIGVILREYYKENTMNTKMGWKEKFDRAGITKDEGISAIACARRLGMDIS